MNSVAWTGKRITRIPLYVFLITLLLTALAYVIDSSVLGNWGKPFAIMTGAAPPWGPWAWLGVLLSIAGWLLVPSFLGLAVADILSRLVAGLLLSPDRAQQMVDNLVAAGQVTPPPPKDGPAGPDAGRRP